MKKTLLLPLLVAGLWATPAVAETYVSASVGLGMLGNADATVGAVTVKDVVEFKSGVSFGGAVGYKFADYRAEGAVSYQSNEIDKTFDENGNKISVTGVDTSVLSFMVNGYRDFVIKDSGVTPYVMAGVGLASVNVDDNGDSVVDESGFAWQLGTGVGIKASDSVIVDLGYRYFNRSKVEDKSGTVDFDISGSNLLAGFRYTF